MLSLERQIERPGGGEAGDGRWKNEVGVEWNISEGTKLLEQVLSHMITPGNMLCSYIDIYDNGHTHVIQG